MTVAELIAALGRHPPGELVVVAGAGEYDLAELCPSSVYSIQLVRYDTSEGEVIEEYRCDLEDAARALPGVFIG